MDFSGIAQTTAGSNFIVGFAPFAPAPAAGAAEFVAHPANVGAVAPAPVVPIRRCPAYRPLSSLFPPRTF